MKKTPLQIANDTELEKLKKTYNKLRRLITGQGFCTEWYSTISSTKNGSQAFHELNDFFYNNTLPHTYRYSSYRAFLTVIKRKK